MNASKGGTKNGVESASPLQGSVERWTGGSVDKKTATRGLPYSLQKVLAEAQAGQGLGWACQPGLPALKSKGNVERREC